MDGLNYYRKEDYRRIELDLPIGTETTAIEAIMLYVSTGQDSLDARAEGDGVGIGISEECLGPFSMVYRILKTEKDEHAQGEYFVILEMTREYKDCRLLMLDGSNFLHRMDDAKLHDILRENIRGYVSLC